MAPVSPAPCQCSSPGAAEMLSPVWIRCAGSSRDCTQPSPSTTWRSWPPAWRCQWLRLPAAKRTTLTETGCGSAELRSGCEVVGPVKWEGSTGPPSRASGRLVIFTRPIVISSAPLRPRDPSLPSPSRGRERLLGARFVPGDHPAPRALHGHQLGGRLRTPGAAPVDLRVALRLPRLEQRVHDLPRALDLPATGEDRVAAGQHLAEHVLIGVRELLAGQPAVLQLHPGRDHLEAAPRPLGADPEQDALVGLEADHDQRRYAALAASPDPEVGRVAKPDHRLRKLAA